MAKKYFTKKEKKSYFNGLRFGAYKTDRARKYLKRKEDESKIKFDRNGEPVGDPYWIKYQDNQRTLKNIGYYDIDEDLIF